MSEEGWSDSVLVWNGVAAGVPALVVRPASQAELEAAVAFAHEHGLRVAVEQSAAALPAERERCLTIDLWSNAEPAG